MNHAIKLQALQYIVHLVVMFNVSLTTESCKSVTFLFQLNSTEIWVSFSILMLTWTVPNPLSCIQSSCPHFVESLKSGSCFSTLVTFQRSVRACKAQPLVAPSIQQQLVSRLNTIKFPVRLNAINSRPWILQLASNVFLWKILALTRQ